MSNSLVAVPTACRGVTWKKRKIHKVIDALMVMAVAYQCPCWACRASSKAGCGAACVAGFWVWRALIIPPKDLFQCEERMQDAMHG